MHHKTGQTPMPALRPTPWEKTPATAKRLRRTPLLESLESRLLYAVQAPVTLTAEGPVNVTKLLENQHTGVIAVNRTDPGNVFIATVTDRRGTGPMDDQDLDLDNDPDQLEFFADSDNIPENDVQYGTLGAVSADGGRTFTLSSLAGNTSSPSVAYDRFGNLFAAFYSQTITVDPDDPFFGGFISESSVNVALSTDGGATFQIIESINVNPQIVFDFFDDNLTATASPQPTVVTGADTVWVCFEDSTFIAATGARVLGLGAVEDFIEPQDVPRSTGGKFADIAIGPSGEVMVTYEILRDDPDAVPEEDQFFGTVLLDPDGTFSTGGAEGPAEIFVNVDPDGLGTQTFGRRFKVTDTNVGLFDPISAQNERTIDAAPGIVWDRSGGPFNGRVWLVYTDEARNNSNNDTEIYLRFSDDDGQTWSSRRQVNDEDVTEGSQFLPNIAIDQTTGNLAFSWYDTRLQNGFSIGQNDETQFFGTVGVPTTEEAGIAFADNVQLSNGFSDAPRSRGIIEYGEYSDLDFHNNVFYVAWSDNSGSTGDNPSGGLNSSTATSTFDTYTTRVMVLPNSPRPPELNPVGPGSPLIPEFVGRDTLTKGKNFKFQVRYTSPNGIDQSTLGDDDLLITGPNGYNLFADFTKSKQARRGTIVTATYLAPAPGGLFDVGDNGLYTILLQGGSVSELGGAVISADGLLDQFLVSSNVRAQSPALQAAPPVSASLQSSDSDDSGDDADEKFRALGL
jgi:hypothetical protein